MAEVTLEFLKRHLEPCIERLEQRLDGINAQLQEMLTLLHRLEQANHDEAKPSKR